jgi:hypothetical protein
MTTVKLIHQNLTQIPLLSADVVSLNLNSNPIREISNLETLTNLHDLKLNGSFIVDKIQGLSTLTNLRELYLGINKIKTIEGLDTLIGLQILDLPGNNITKIDGIAMLTNLHTLNLSNNFITEITNIFTLTKLVTLLLSVNAIKHVPMNLLQLRNLKYPQFGSSVTSIPFPVRRFIGRQHHIKHDPYVHIGHPAIESLKQSINNLMDDSELVLEKHKRLNDGTYYHDAEYYAPYFCSDEHPYFYVQKSDVHFYVLNYIKQLRNSAKLEVQLKKVISEIDPQYSMTVWMAKVMAVLNGHRDDINVDVETIINTQKFYEINKAAKEMRSLHTTQLREFDDQYTRTRLEMVCKFNRDERLLFAELQF